MFAIIAVTNRRLCAEPFLERLASLAKAGVSAIILREKDLPPAQYLSLARHAADVCGPYGVPLVPHGSAETARELGSPQTQMPFPTFAHTPEAEKRRLKIGVSVHALAEAQYAEAHGAASIVAGHIFPTDCKPGLPAQGVGFLAELCREVAIPVYGIGGIAERHIPALRNAGAAGACLMSSLMQCPDPEAYLARLYRAAQDTELMASCF